MTTYRIYTTYEQRFEVFDVHALSDNDLAIPGFYVTGSHPPPPTTTTDDTGIQRTHTQDVTARWYGLNVWVSEDGVNYVHKGVIGSSATLGVCASVPSGTSESRFQGDGTFDCYFTDGTPSSATTARVLSGANLTVVGSEIIGFETSTASPTISGRWTLSNLYRGLRGTGELNITHDADDEPNVWVVTNDSYLFVPMSLNSVGKTIYVKATMPDGPLSEVTAKSFTFAGNNLKPFAPVLTSSTRDSGNNITINWARRTQVFCKLYGGSAQRKPLIEGVESYDIVVTGGSTFTTTSPTLTYTSTQQTADGKVPGAPVEFTIYQVSDRVARGIGTTITI